MHIVLYTVTMCLSFALLIIAAYPRKGEDGKEHSEFYQVLTSLFALFLFQYLGFASFDIYIDAATTLRDAWLAATAEVAFVVALLVLIYRVFTFAFSWRRMKRRSLDEAKELGD